MSYVPILDSEVGPDAPITTSLMFRLRDNPLGMFAADPGAPPLNRGAINIGGSGTDLNMIDSTTLGSDGVYDFADITISTDRAIPPLCILRATGTVNISANLQNSYTVTPALARMYLAAGYKVGSLYDTTPDVPLDTYVGCPLSAYDLNRLWAELAKRPFVGGGGTPMAGKNPFSQNWAGGGCLVILADGPIVITGNINCIGVFDTGYPQATFGSGGSIIIVSGTSINAPSPYFGVSGTPFGTVYLVAPVVTGSPTVYGGGPPNIINTLTQAQINGILLGN
jgi:hypothetical protein